MTAPTPRRGRRRRVTDAARLVRPVLAAALGLLLTGCGGLATDQVVRPGLELGAKADTEPRVMPVPPTDGLSREAVVSGFVRAGAGSDGEYEVAREYLTDEVANAWNPDGDIVVVSATPTATLIPPNTVRLTGSVVATIDAQGSYRQVAAGTQQSADFTMAQRGEQWRIGALADGFGRWVTASDVDRLFDAYRVHYVSTGERGLISDTRWFPADHIPTRLVKALLSPLPAHLAGAARSDFPPGAALATGSVPVTRGVARVDLTGPNIGTDEATRQNIWAQLVSTLMQSPEVAAVSVTVDDRTLDIEGLLPPVASLAQLSFPERDTRQEATPWVSRSGQLFVVDTAGGGSAEPAADSPVGQDGTGSGWTDLALSSSSTEVAGVDTARETVARWRTGIRYEVPAFARQLGRPAYDLHDVLWVGGVSAAEPDARLWWVNAAADPTDVDRAGAQPLVVDWLADRVVVAARLSPDGSRIAILSVARDAAAPDEPVGRGGTVGAGRLDVAAVIREPNGLPRDLTLPQRAGTTLSAVRDAVWVDVDNLAVIADADGTRGVHLVRLGGRESALSEVTDAVSITSTGGARDLYLVTADQEVLFRAGSVWLPVSEGGTAVLVPGA